MNNMSMIKNVRSQVNTFVHVFFANVSNFLIRWSTRIKINVKELPS